MLAQLAQTQNIANQTRLKITQLNNQNISDVNYFIAYENNSTDICKVIRVIDGDSVVIQFLYTGYNGIQRFYKSLRLTGIDAPEKGTKKGEESKQKLEEYIFSGDFGGIVFIRFKGEDGFGRLLGEVFKLINYSFMEQKSLNQTMIDEGFAEKEEYN